MPIPADARNRDCPWCGTKDVSMQILQENKRFSSSKGGGKEWTWLGCTRCGKVISLETQSNAVKVLEVIPNRKEDSDVSHLPEDVEEYYTNAKIVLGAGVTSSAAVELRRTLEAAARHQDITETPLVKAIEKMVEKGLITTSFKDVLGHIKKIGNQGAHATDEPLSEEEVRVALRFTTQVLRNLFEVPEELKLLNNPTGSAENS